MKYFIGIDGGGTKTEMLLCDEQGMVLGHAISSGSNPADNNLNEAVNSLEKLIDYSLERVSNDDIKYISICIPGLKKYENMLSCLKTFKGRYDITGDELNAFYGAIAKDYGIIVLSGTGSFSLGINKGGYMFTAGGWGPLTGDDGSGYYIGIQALRAVMKEYDGMGNHTLLTELLKSYIKVHDIDELKRVLYNEDFGVKKIAGIASLVRYGALNNDKVCIDIINDCAYRLFLLSDVVIRKLGMDNDNYDLCLTGGIKNFRGLITDPLKKFLNDRYKNIKMNEPILDPVAGNIILCFKHDNRRLLPENIEILKKSLMEVNIDVI